MIPPAPVKLHPNQMLELVNSPGSDLATKVVLGISVSNLELIKATIAATTIAAATTTTAKNTIYIDLYSNVLQLLQAFQPATSRC